MSLTAQKIPFGKSINNTINALASDALQALGQNLPAEVVSVNGAIVTVKVDVKSGYNIPNLTIPMIGSEYLRMPIQPGCMGVVISIDAQIGVISGLGTQQRNNLVQPGNLSALVFVPVGNVNFFTVPSDKAVLYGPQGVILSASDNHGFIGTQFTLTSDSITFGNVTITANDVSVNGVSLMHHVHGGVTGGTDNTGEPIS